MRIIFDLGLVLVLVMAANTASAQPDARGNAWGHGTTATALAGVATDGSRGGPTIGGAIGWEVTPRFGIEGDGSWVRFGDGMDGFVASLKARIRVFGTRPIDPFVQGGVGLYRMSFSPMHARRPPRFYQRRMIGRLASGGSEMSFTDPSLVAGGGINIFITRHLAVRPMVESAIVLRDRHRYVVTTVALQAVFHFEDHPVTPSVGSSNLTRGQHSSRRAAKAAARRVRPGNGRLYDF